MELGLCGKENEFFWGGNSQRERERGTMCVFVYVREREYYSVCLYVR